MGGAHINEIAAEVLETLTASERDEADGRLAGNSTLVPFTQSAPTNALCTSAGSGGECFVDRALPAAFAKLRVLSLFAGIGGFDLGLERTGGFETVAVAEVDPYASRVLAMRFPNAPNVGDVTKANYPDADIICAGFPCQDISFAGAGAGLAGARSGLFREVVRAIGLVRPKFAILENVAALLGRGLDDVLRALAEIGYDAEWHCIPASAVGAPHRRDRIWIVAYPGGEQHQSGRAPLSGQIAAELSRALADAAPMFGQAVEWGEPDGDHASLGTLADATGSGWGQGHQDARGSGKGAGQEEERAGLTDNGWWLSEPDVGRVAHGIPKRVDRLRCLGNSVVPQIPELIGNAILASMRSAEHDTPPIDVRGDGQGAGGASIPAIGGITNERAFGSEARNGAGVNLHVNHPTGTYPHNPVARLHNYGTVR